MLTNTNIHIDEIECDYFDKDEGAWCVDAWWEDDEGINTEYQGEETRDRGAAIAYIQENGSTWEFKDNFGEAITEDNDNAWVLEEIENYCLKIKDKYFNGGLWD